MNAELLSKFNDIQGRPPVEVLASAFLAIAPFFKLYTIYCANYSSALASLAAIKEKNGALIGNQTHHSPQMGA